MTTTQRHIAVLTGKRGGYGAMRPMLRAIEEAPELRLSLIVTDQHVNPKFGATASEVARDFEIAAAIDMGQSGDSPAERTAAIATCMAKMADVLERLRPDILVLYGDRGEVVAAAVAAVNLSVPIAHVQGGDVSGNVDDLFRHAVSKLAHLHFPSTEASAARLRAMGEEPWRIHVVGDNHVDAMFALERPDPDDLRRRYEIAAGERPILVLQHAETIRPRDHRADMAGTLAAVRDAGRRALVVYPCSDQGYEGVIAAIEERRGAPGLSIHTNIDAPDFLGLMRMAAVMVGNSSAGLIETPYARIPAVNVGERQRGREHAENVIHCEMGRAPVAAALDRALNDPAFAETVAACRQPFGDGQSYKRIVAALRETPLGQELLEKPFVDAS